MIVRAPAVAGTFYPASPEVLAARVDELVAAVPPGDCRPKALIVPHAGYVYSGSIAATAFARVPADVERIVLVGPAHRVAVRDLAWPGAGILRTPIGDVRVDVDAIEALELPADPHAHAREHSLEVELPFILRVAPHATVVPLVTSHATAARVGEVLDAGWGGPETLIVISSDLSHYLPYDAGRERDARTAARIVACEHVSPGDACGAAAIDGLSRVAKKRKLACEVLDLRSSGDTAGSRDEVVGYGAFAYREVA